MDRRRRNGDKEKKRDDEREIGIGERMTRKEKNKCYELLKEITKKCKRAVWPTQTSNQSASPIQSRYTEFKSPGTHFQ
jgi:hypothetical protein